MKIFALIVMGIVHCGNPPPPPPEAPPAVIQDVPRVLDHEWVMTESAIKESKLSAMRGDGGTALKLGLHYTSQFIDDKAESLRWMLIAAENGNPSGQYNVGFHWLRSDDPLLRVRAVFWLRSAAALGEPNAKRMLNEIEDDIDSTTNAGNDD